MSCTSQWSRSVTKNNVVRPPATPSGADTGAEREELSPAPMPQLPARCKCNSPVEAPQLAALNHLELSEVTHRGAAANTRRHTHTHASAGAGASHAHTHTHTWTHKQA